MRADSSQPLPGVSKIPRLWWRDVIHMSRVRKMICMRSQSTGTQFRSAENDWRQHQPRAMRRCHHKRPQGQVAEAYAHAYPGRAAGTNQAIAAKAKNARRRAKADGLSRQIPLREP